jgi:hypothetical protein
MRKYNFLIVSLSFVVSASFLGCSSTDGGGPTPGTGAGGSGGSPSGTAGSSVTSGPASGGSAGSGTGGTNGTGGGLTDDGGLARADASIDTNLPPDQDASTDANQGTGARDGASGIILGWPPADAPAVAPPDFGPNVLIFDPATSATAIQTQLDQIATKQNATTPQNAPVGFGYGAEYSTNRYAYFFKPGQYMADVKVGYYVQALGLGHSPDDVTINGAVRVKADWRTDDPGNALLNFWRGAENLAVVPTLAADNRIDVWGVSQATHLRRIHIEGNIALSDGGFSSGGFIADSKIDTRITSGSQQQFLTRNTTLTSWQGGSWNMVFVGDGQPPAGTWPTAPITIVPTTPVIREKPFVFIEKNGNYYVMVPSLKTNTTGPTWASAAAPGNSLPIDRFYLAKPGIDTAATINVALAQGKHLLLLPGIYHLADSIQISNPDTIVLGLGIPTLIPDKPIPAVVVADVDGVTLAGFMIDAGPMSSPTLLEVGSTGSSADHSKDPTALFDVHCRIGGAEAGLANSCFTINSNDVLIDHIWLWRSDDGAGVSWTGNKSNTGITVNGNNVTAYGLFVEHFQQYQTIWNGNGGKVYFYQSEMPYDVPMQTSWQHDGINGYASYKVGDSVTTHDARGVGVYCVFNNAVVSANAVETPPAAGVTFQHIVTLRFGGAAGSGITHIINGTGGAVGTAMSAKTPN